KSTWAHAGNLTLAASGLLPYIGEAIDVVSIVREVVDWRNEKATISENINHFKASVLLLGFVDWLKGELPNLRKMVEEREAVRERWIKAIDSYEELYKSLNKDVKNFIGDSLQ